MIETDYLRYRPEEVEPSLFRQWRDNPCTKELKRELMLALFDQFDTDLPESIDKSVPLMHQREGARKTIDLLLDWEPKNIKKLRHAASGFLEEVDSAD
jgi:hypothetical protein